MEESKIFESGPFWLWSFRAEGWCEIVRRFNAPIPADGFLILDQRLIRGDIVGMSQEAC